MAEVTALSRGRMLWQRLRDFVTAHTMGTAGAVIFVILAVFLLWPIIAMLAKSVSGSEGFTLEYYKNFVTDSWYWRSFFNTLILGAAATAVCLTVGFCIAYVTTRGPRLLRTPLRLVTLLPLIAPPYIFALSLIILLGHSGIITKALNLEWSLYGFSGVIIAQTLAFIPMAYIIVENSLSSLSPNLEDSAANLGASEGKIIKSITLPLLAPAFWKAGLVVFVLSVAEFGNVALLHGRVPFLAPEMYTLITGARTDFSMATVLAMFLMFPSTIIFIAQGYMLRGKGFATIVGKPVAAEERHITPVILIPILAVSFMLCALILLNFGVVIVGAFTNIVGIDNTFTLRNLTEPRSLMAIGNSLRISLLAALFGALLGVILAYVVVRGKFKGRATLEGMSLWGFAFPGVAMGIGYIVAFNNPPLLLTGTMAILVICSVMRSFMIGVEAGINKLQQLSIEVEEASFNLGANTVTTFWRIVLPIIFPAFMYGFLYNFMRTMITLSAVIFLITPGTYLASVFIFDKTSMGDMGSACATSLQLIIVVGITLGIIQYLSRWTGLSVTKKGI